MYADIEVGPLVLGFTSPSWSVEGLSVVGDLSMEAGTEYGSESFTEHTARLASVDVSGDLWVDADLENTGELNTLDTTYGSSLTMDDVSVAGTAILGSRTVALYGVDVDGGTWTSARFFEAWWSDLHGVDAPGLTVVVDQEPGLVMSHSFNEIGGDVAFVESSYEAPVTFASDDLGEEWSCAFDDLGVDCTSQD